MKEITLKIPDEKLNFSMDLINKHGFDIVESSEISEEHKELVRERLVKNIDENLKIWDEVVHTVKYKTN